MPVATSPYIQNDYASAASNKPYQLPSNEIFEAVKAQNEFWIDGAQRVKNEHDNVLQLELSLEPNKKIRDEFMIAADKQLDKLSSMNLSDPSIQRQGFNIYAPIFKDEGIMYDDQMTKHYDKVRSDALSYRDKNGGKEFNYNNLVYGMDGYNEFINSKDRMAGKKMWGSRKEYEPYYDAAPEINTAIKGCKPDDMSRDVETGLMITTYSDKSLSATKLGACITAGLSPKARRQMQIDGYVTYKNNLPALRDAYLPGIEETASTLKQKNAAYAAILENKDKLKSLSDTELAKLGLSKADITPDLINHLSSLSQDNDLRIANLNKTIGELRAGDFSSISGENFEPVAGNVIQDTHVAAYANAFAYSAISQKDKANPAQMMIYKENRQDMRQEDQQQFMLQMQTMKDQTAENVAEIRKGKLTGPNGVALSPEELQDRETLNGTNNPFISPTDKDSSYDKLVQKRVDFGNQKAQLNKTYYGLLKSWGMTEDKVSYKDFYSANGTFMAWRDNFLKSLPKDDPKWEIQRQYENQMHSVIQQDDLVRNNVASIDQEIQKNNKDLFVSDLSKLKPINIKGTTITPKDVQDALSGGSAKLKIVQGANGNPDRYIVNGQDIGNIYTPSSHYLRQMVSDIIGQEGQRVLDLKSKRNELANTMSIIQGKGYQFPELDDYGTEKDVDTFKRRIMQSVGLTGKDKSDAFTVGQVDGMGNVEVTINDDSGSNPKWDKKDLLKKFKETYSPNGLMHETGDDKYHIVIGGFKNLDITNPVFNGAQGMVPMIRNMETRVTDLAPVMSGTIRSSNPHKQFGVEISKAMSLEPDKFTYRVYDESGNTWGNYSDRITALQMLQLALDNPDGIKNAK